MVYDRDVREVMIR